MGIDGSLETLFSYSGLHLSCVMLCSVVSVSVCACTRSCMQPLARLPVGMISISYAQPAPAEEDLNLRHEAAKDSDVKLV